jgi:hypothetical protein
MIGDPAWFQLPVRVRWHPYTRGYGRSCKLGHLVRKPAVGMQLSVRNHMQYRPGTLLHQGNPDDLM